MTRRPPHVLKPGTAATYESLLRSRILPTFERKQLRAVKPSDVTAWIGGMVSEGLSPSRIRQSHVVLRLVFEAAVADGFLARNPALGTNLPRLGHQEAPYFAPDVVDALSDAMESPDDVLTAILGVCGLRWGEAVALRRRHVDLLRRRLRVEHSLAEVSGHFVFGRTKSHATRAVPLSPGMVTAIEAHLKSIDADRDAQLFMGPRARGPLRYRYYWRPAVERLGLPEVGVHVPRHSAAARIVAAGGITEDVAVGSRPPERRLQPDRVRAFVRRRPRCTGSPPRCQRKESTVSAFSAHGVVESQSQYADSIKGRGELTATDQGFEWTVRKLLSGQKDGAR